MKKILWSPKFLVSTFLIGTIYLVIAIYLMNYKLVLNTTMGDYPFLYKLNILTALLEGMWTAMRKSSLAVLVITSLFSGANLTLVVKKLVELKEVDNLQLVAGSGSLLGVVGSGCAACGLTVIALLGLGGSLVYLPFHGTELAYIALGLLAVSLFTLLKSSSQPICEIASNKKVITNKLYVYK